MIYFDNAATTYPKPNSVVQSLSSAARHFGGNPGRSGHEMSMRAAAMVYDTRKKAAALFNVQPENVIFTLNCTHALNMAIKGAVKPGGHVVMSCLEHNSVLRPVYALEKGAGVTSSIVEPGLTDEQVVQAFEHRHAKADVGHKMPVHHVIVQHLCAGIQHHAAVCTQPAKISRKNRRTYNRHILSLRSVIL